MTIFIAYDWGGRTLWRVDGRGIGTAPDRRSFGPREKMITRGIRATGLMAVISILASCSNQHDALDLRTPLDRITSGMTLVHVQALFPSNGVAMCVTPVTDQRGDWMDGNVLWKRIATNAATQCLTIDDREGWFNSRSCVYFGLDGTVIGFYHSTE